MFLFFLVLFFRFVTRNSKAFCKIERPSQLFSSFFYLGHAKVNWGVAKR